MTEAPPAGLAEREALALRTFEQLAAERARLETETERTFRYRREEEERAYTVERQRIVSIARADTTDTKAKYEAAKAQILRDGDAETRALEAEYAEAKRAVASKAQTARNRAKKRQEETRWQALAMFEAGKDNAIKQFKAHEKQLKEAGELLEDQKLLTAPVLARVRRFAPPKAEPPTAVAPEQPIEAIEAALARIEEEVKPIDALFLPKFLAPQVFVWPFLLLAGGLSFVLGQSLGLGWKVGPGIAAVVAIAAGVGAFVALAKQARKSVAAVQPPLVATLDEIEHLIPIAMTWAKAAFENAKNEVELKRQRDCGAADDLLATTVADADQKREQAQAEVDAIHPPKIQAAAERKTKALAEADVFFPNALNTIQERYKRDVGGCDAKRQAQIQDTDRTCEAAWAAVVDRWRTGLDEVDAIVRSVNEVSTRMFLDWNQPELDVEAWEPPAGVPPGLRFGGLTLDMADIPQGVPVDPRLKPIGPTRHVFPAVIPFPEQGSVLIKAGDAAGKLEAVKLLQTLMLRYATSIPAGKVRYTIVDPVGLGENFASFMHLADYNEQLITSRIWTETPHIEQRLADLSGHMENVIQKYLRNEFETIEAYNEFAGEVAEPFRVLVVANFPANFSETAARRLLSIASTGARCGVYVLVSLDTKLAVPTGFALKDLEGRCTNFFYRDGKMSWKEPQLGRLPLTYDVPPDSERYTKLMHRYGLLAKNANKVEVPFEYIAPKPEDYWTASSASTFDVPLGRAGATKLQHIKLGKGTSQHVLTAGKTGSGKSTLLHAMITNAALRYSPDEIELYLIDFKKGVEFKVYAAYELPHARVIAVESEREFGLSVLQKLDSELKQRGDTYRDVGCQDLRGYREATGGNPPMPRILLIVDEFQEFFVEDDKIAQEVGLLLDRLVRQGRAFGIHVILGSQSLGGAYSLARSTIGQMAVRIALQCSESDSSLILSEENSAARLLTRPGEAIYNDANGLVEGNNFFQVVWLSDERREAYLRELKQLAHDRGRPPAQQIVFEGNLPAVPSKNHLLAALLEAETWGEPPKADYAWLGEAIAIKDPTAAIFRPQSGANLLVVGQNDLMALGMAITAMIGLAAQHDTNGIEFLLLDGSPADSPMAGKLALIKDVIPHTVREVTMRDLGKVFTEIAAEMERRQREAVTDVPAIYLVIHDIQRFRDLRKSEDDFGFSSPRYGEEDVVRAEPPSRLFGNILKDGPAQGIHTLVWCDSLNNLNRTFDRNGLREFELRVLFQMSANDSSTLIDSPAAGKLGPNRALFFSEEEGRLEKFRPYGLPTEDWLTEVRKHMMSRPIPPPRPAPTPTNGHDDAGSLPAEPTGFGSAFTSLDP